VDEILPVLREATSSLQMVSPVCAAPFEKWIHELSKKNGYDDYPKEVMRTELEQVWDILNASLA
jgi:hypothetical protein